VDHLIYGWVFFGIVIGLAFWIGSFWEDAPETRSTDIRAAPASAAATGGAAAIALLAVAVAGFAANAAWPSLAATLQATRLPTLSLASLAGRIHPHASAPARTEYRPAYKGGIARISGQLTDDPGVGVQVIHYLRQSEHGEMITWHNRILPAGPEDLTWQVRRKRSVEPSTLGSNFPGVRVNEYEIIGPAGRYLAWEWFWVNGRMLTDPRSIKLHTAIDLLRGRGDESLAWFLWTAADDNGDTVRQRLARAADSFSGAPLPAAHR